jgi:teichuronic acid biosynthesis glycosyltransferase TuaC
MKVLSLSCVFPNPSEPGLGPFVRSRLQRVAAFVEIKVIAPVPVFDYSRTEQKWIGSRAIPLRRQDEALEVFHPRWLYPPLVAGGNPLFLYGRLIASVRHLRKRFPFDLIDAHFAFPDGIAAAMLAQTLGVPFVVTLRGNEPMHAGQPVRRWLIQRALRRAARVICVSENLRRFAIDMGADAARVKTIPNGIDTALFYPRDPEACRRKHDIPLDAKVVLSAGTLIERKGHHRAVQALHDLRQEESLDTLLLIAGGPGREGRFEHRIRELVSRLGMESRVRFLGHISPTVLPELMSAADLFCLASSREGWPNVVHEAMGCGTPVVATEVGGVADMAPSEDYGFVVPPGDTGALRVALGQALHREWNRQRIADWARARSWQNVAAEVLEEFRAALSA